MAKKLYHFTSRWVLPRILREGIQRGDTCITPELGFAAPWMTTDPGWSRQAEWSKLSAIDKTEVRLEVTLPDGFRDTRLRTWEQLYKQYDSPLYWQESMTQEDFYYCRLGGVPVRFITKIEFKPDLKPMDIFTVLPSPNSKIQHMESRGTPQKPKKPKVTNYSASDWLKKTENWVNISGSNFPWADMPTRLLQVLAKGTAEEAATGGLRYCRNLHVNLVHGAEGGNQRGTLPARTTLTGMSHWLRSNRRIVSVTPDSSKLLRDETDRARLWALPVPTEKPWRLGQLFHLQPNRSDQNNGRDEVLMWMEPLVGQAGVRFAVWARGLKKRWGAVLPRLQNLVPLDALGDVINEPMMIEDAEVVGVLEKTADYDLPGRIGLMEYTTLSETFGSYKLGIGADGCRYDLEGLIRMGVNALAAIHENPRIVIGRRRAPRSKKGSKTGGVDKVRRLTLDESGTRLLTRRWLIEPTPKQVVPIAHRPHRSPCLHTVEPHRFSVWVKAPKLDESILGTKERVRAIKNKEGRVIREETYLLYKVKRMRGRNGAFSRGEGIRPKRTALVTGVADLTI